MKNVYFLILISIWGLNLNAQITLTQSSTSTQIGDSYDYVFSTGVPVGARQAGANQTWDFSGLTGTSAVVEYIDISNSLEPGSFPNANIVEKVLGAENYYADSASGRILVGQLVPGIARLIIDNDQREFLKYPISYNDVYNETFSGTMYNLQTVQTFIRSGTCEIVADGYGDLILPDTTIENVLRVRSSYEYNDVFMNNQVAVYHDTIYSWYSADTKGYVATVSVNYSNGFFGGEQATYMQPSSFAVDIDEFALIRQQVSFYPNPAREQIIIKNETNTPLVVSIHDMRGKLVKSTMVRWEEEDIDVSELSSGVYFIKYDNGNAVYSEKLIVE